MTKIERIASPLNVNPATHFYYGISYSTERGFITRQQYSNGLFVARTTKNITNGNGWVLKNGETLHGAILELLSAGFSVYEFKTEGELFYWLYNGEG